MQSPPLLEAGQKNAINYLHRRLCDCMDLEMLRSAPEEIHLSMIIFQLG